MNKNVPDGGTRGSDTEAGRGKEPAESAAIPCETRLAAAHAEVDTLKAVLDAAPQATMLLDSDTNILAMNRAARAFVGQEDRLAVGLPCGDILRCGSVAAGAQCGQSPQCEACVVRTAVRETFLTRTPICDRQGRLIVCCDGAPLTRHILVSTSFVDTVQGPRVLLSVHDITCMHRAQEAAAESLRESEERWQFALEGAGDGVWDWNVTTGEVFFSRRWKQMLGYEEHEVTSHLREWDSRVHPDDRQRVYADLNRHLAGQSPAYVSEHRMLCKDGTYRWILDSGKVVRRAADGSPERVIGTHKDITERKRVEEALRASESKFSKAFENAPALMTISSLEDGTYLDVNEAFLKVSGFSRDEAIGQTSTDLGWISPEDRSRIIAPLREAGRIADIELTLHAKGGREVTCLYHGELINIEGRDRLLSIAVDITDRKQHQREQEAVLSILRLANTTGNTHELIQAVTGLLQAWSGCEAVGVRLRDGEDFPYFETCGFPAAFVAAENRLCAVDAGGETVRDSQGNCVLECMCGNVLCGRFDPAKPFFTAQGSFWSNHTSHLLASTTGADRQARTRNRCNGEGYESVALIPLRTGSQTIGLLQFNDRRRNRFSPGSIEMLERLADNLAIALANRQAEDALHEHRQNLASLFNAIHESVFMIDRTGILLAANATFARRLNTELRKLIGQSIYTLLPPGVSATRLTQAEQVTRTGQGVTFEDERDGRQFRTSLWPITDASGTVIRLVGFATDITDQRRTEQRIQAMASMLDAAPNSITVHDLSGRFLYANRKSLDIHGYTDEAEFLSVNLHDLDVPESAALIEPRIKQVAAAGEARFEVEHFRKNGTRVPLEVFVKPVSWAGIPALISVATDLTERRRAEVDLRASEERYRTLINNIGLGVVLIGDDYRIRSANPAQARLFGKKPEELIGRECFREFEKRDRICPECPGKLALETGQPHEIDRQGVHDDGQTHIARVCAFPLAGPSGRADAFVEVTENITERRRLEFEFRQAQKMEAIGRLAAGVAHDFNNQLTVIQGYSEMILRVIGKDNPLWEPLSQIRQAAKRAHSTTSHLLSFSRKQILEPTIVDLREFLMEAQAPIARMIGEDIRLDVVTDPGCAPILIDKSGLHQAIMNLVVNARDAMPDGGTLVLRASTFHLAAGEASKFPEASPGKYVLLQVVDSGLGMDPQTLEQVFEPFFTTKEPGKGTGLGLPMVMGFVRQSKGFLRIDSEPGKGTAVRILLPPAGSKPEDSTDALPALSGGDGRSGKTILLTEDEDGVRRYVASLLERSGHRVLSAGRPTEALRISQEHEGPIDLLISDVVMPEMRGTELARRLRSSRPEIRVLLITGYTEMSAYQENEEFLRKPFETKDLLDRIQALIG